MAARDERSAREWVDAIRDARAQLKASASPPSLSPPLSPTSSSTSSSLSSPSSATKSSRFGRLRRKSASQGRDTSASGAASGTFAIPHSSGDEGGLIAGEQLLHGGGSSEPDVLFAHHALRDCRRGALWVTNYRLIFIAQEMSDCVPLAMVMKVEQVRHAEQDLPGFALKCKDFRSVSVFFLTTELHKAISAIFKQRLCPAKLSDLFAYKNKESFAAAPVNASGFCVYDAAAEFKRQQTPDKQWRITRLNRDFRYPRFPNLFVVPAAITDDTITQFWKSSHKWQQLTLSLCWRSRDASGGASLLRAFPVLVDEDQGSGGLADTDSLWMAGGLKEEEGKPLYMLQHVLLLHPRTDEVHVFNTAGSRKKASSSEPERDGKTIELSDGKRIRMRKAVLMSPSAVDESLGKLSDLVSTFDARLFSSSAADGGDGRAQEWRRSMDTTTLWLTGLRRLLAATANVVKQLLLGTPVVVTNRDGGESVPQVVSLAQVVPKTPWQESKLLLPLLVTHFVGFVVLRLGYLSLLGYHLLVEAWAAHQPLASGLITTACAVMFSLYHLLLGWGLFSFIRAGGCPPSPPAATPTKPAQD
ncbi:Protein-tyrosine-phosphatase [Acanthamoeba castellanii str. Neff]|uniref:Protein-tyrosine-phosphatase n=1 Tax=Acanthamoeba castellanii (strain ATCC 30010 / Neff) TaxID=1257118 RepID=L8GQW9_ACACF|nr:Protein-tyrosine-phosphatase [Acanthamoeba castellanii str. Neff]ELR15043.1 Protein-tyrosine-phosphatase [Acanthamoeba castellanii str. Neff]